MKEEGWEDMRAREDRIRRGRMGMSRWRNGEEGLMMKDLEKGTGRDDGRR